MQSSYYSKMERIKKTIRIINTLISNTMSEKIIYTVRTRDKKLVVGSKVDYFENGDLYKVISVRKVKNANTNVLEIELI